MNYRAFNPTRVLHRQLRAAALLVLASASAGHAAPKGPQGALLYHNYCSVCHGDRGDGKSRATGALSTPPRDFSSEASRRELTRERIAVAVAHGVPGTAMAGWKTQLSPADVGAVTDYVMNQFMRGDAAARGTNPAVSGTHAHGGRESDGAARTQGFPKGMRGDLRRGSAFYIANCATCHGAAGDGAGPRAYFINPKPRNFVEASTSGRFDRAALYTAVADGRLGTEMPAWKQVASPQQIADVAEYVYQAFIVARTGAPSAAALPAPK